MTLGDEIGAKTFTDRGKRNGWFITFSQCGDLNKQQFYDDFVAKHGEAQQAVAATEPHKKGGFHIHMAIVMKEKISKAEIISHYQAKYGIDSTNRINVQSLRNLNKAIDYFTDPVKSKDVDLSPLFINCEVSDVKNERLHHYFLREISDMKTKPFIYEICNCSKCMIDLREHLKNDYKNFLAEEHKFENLVFSE